MKRLRAWMLRIAGIFGDDRRERELADELNSHLQMHIDDNIRRGMTPQEARRNAILKLGGLESTKQAYREGSTFPAVENLLQDLRFAIRQLRKNPGFACTAIFILALGLGASVAIFAFVDATLIKPLPYQNPTRLAGVFETADTCPVCNLSYLDYLDWKKLNKSFSSLDAYTRSHFMMSTPTGMQDTPGVRISDGFFRTLGIAPLLGRDFRDGEDLQSAPATVMLSYAAWQKRYNGKPDALGQTVTLDGIPNTIIGVLPKEFHFAPGEPAEFWQPLHAHSECELRRSCHNLYGIGRLKDGISLQTALADTKSIAQQLEKQYPDSNRSQGATVMSLSEFIVGDVRPILLLLLSGVGLLLLIACVNIASLLLVRSETRKREMAVRGALGASSGRLIRQFITEGLVLTVAGTALGLAAAYGAMQLLLRLIQTDMLARLPYLQGLGLNIRVLAFAGVIALLVVVLFTITPAMRLPSSDLHAGLAEGGRGAAGTTWRRLGSNLVVLELATAVVLLVAAGLLGKSFYRLLHVQLGLQPDHLATLEIAAPDARYGKDEQAIALERKVLSEIATLPGVKSVGISSELPVGGGGNTTWFRVVGRPWHGEHNDAPERQVSSTYFTTVGARLLRGRYFDEAEDGSKPRVAIINQAMARQYFPGEDPLGKQLTYISRSASPMDIVGIIDDIKEGPLDSEARATIYRPFNQTPQNYFSITVRTSQDEQSVLPQLTSAMHRIDRDIALSSGKSMIDRIKESPSAYIHRSSAWLVGGFAIMALLLSVVGLYGVIAYSVSQRTREIGVRMAVGAQRSSVYQLILKEAGWLTAIGIAAGLVCSVIAATAMGKLLFGVHSWDVPTLLGVATVLGISALLASYIPARRAASVNPVEALRAE